VSYVFDPERGWQWGFRPVKALSTLTTFYGYAYGWYRYECDRRSALV
jgi:hypothetical protein